MLCICHQLERAKKRWKGGVSEECETTFHKVNLHQELREISSFHPLYTLENNGNESYRPVKYFAAKAQAYNPVLRNLLLAFCASLVRGDRFTTRLRSRPPPFFSGPSFSAK